MDSRDFKLWLCLSLLLGAGLLLAGSVERDPSTTLVSVLEEARWVKLGGLALLMVAFTALAGSRWLLPRLRPAADESPDADAAFGNPYATLFLASFVALFVEVMLIRYAGSQVRVFSFYKNVPLIASYLGLGLGCWLGGGRARHVLGFLMWLLPLSVFLSVGSFAAHDWLSSWAASASSEHILGDVAAAPSASAMLASQVLMALFCVATLVAITLLFSLLGRLLGDAFERAPRIPAYTTNIVGSLAGILCFVGLSYLETSPWLWFLVGFAPLFWWLHKPAERALGLVLVAACTLAVIPEVGDTVWSRYQKLVGREIPPGPGGTGMSSPGYLVDISDVFYQVALDLRPEALQELGSNPFPHYDRAFSVLKDDAEVLIVGAGTGNDVAAALRAGAARVDAVDIDAAIVAMGREHHPENPYADPRVRVLIDDARSAFQSLPKQSYDAVVFGLLDSHTQLSMSSVRLDNYVFTLESLEAVRGLLRPGGLVILTAATFRPWFRERFVQMLGATCDSQVAVASYGSWQTYACRVDAPGQPPPGPQQADLVLPTDDWPFLYLPTRSVPQAYVVVVALLVLASLWILRSRGLRLRQFDARLAHLLFLGAAFLLMEVHAVNRLALLFGTTWLVSAVTIGLVLSLIVLANLCVGLLRGAAYRVAYPLLFASLLMSFFLDPSSALGSGVATRLGFGLLLLSPVFFAGIVFARSFASAPLAGPAIAANMFGSAVGGWVEYTSMAVGFKALVLLALCCYMGSLLMHLRANALPALGAEPSPEPRPA